MSVILFPLPARTDGSGSSYGEAAVTIIRACQRTGLDPGRLAAELAALVELQRKFIRATGLDRLDTPDPDLPPCAVDDPEEIR